MGCFFQISKNQLTTSKTCCSFPNMSTLLLKPLASLARPHRWASYCDASQAVVVVPTGCIAAEEVQGGRRVPITWHSLNEWSIGWLVHWSIGWWRWIIGKKWILHGSGRLNACFDVFSRKLTPLRKHSHHWGFSGVSMGLEWYIMVHSGNITSNTI